MRWKSTSVTELKKKAIARLFIFFSGVVLCISAVIVTQLPRPNDYLVWVLWILGLCCILIAAHTMEYKFREVTDDYVAFAVSGLWFSDLYKLYFDETDSISAKYNPYCVQFAFNMKYGAVKLYIRGYREIYGWLFPLFDKLYEKCKLTVSENPRILMIKEWAPPGQPIKKNWYDKFNKRILLFVIIVVVIWNFVIWWFVDRHGTGP